MIIDLGLDAEAEFSNPAVCVVGSGAAGITLAIELQRHGKRVLLLEGGGQLIEPVAQEPYRSELSGFPHIGIHNGRFRTLGGTTTRWGGQILELDELDFTPRPWVSGSGWPFGKVELVRHYERALQIEGLSSAIVEDRRVWSGLGITPMDAIGDKLGLYLSRWCPEPDFSRRYREELINSKRIAVFLHCNAVGFEMTGDGHRIAGVKCRTVAGRSVMLRADSYVLCMGGIETCRFLLQPSESGRYPWSASRLIGKHFQDHIGVVCGEILNIESPNFHRYLDNIFYRKHKYQPKIKLTAQSQSRHETLNVAGTVAVASDAGDALAAAKRSFKAIIGGRWSGVASGDVKLMLSDLPLIARQWYRYMVRHRAYISSNSRIVLQAHCEQEPLSRSTITLAHERDGIGLLRAKLDWRIADREIDSVRHFAQSVQSEFADAGWASVRLDPELLTGDVRVTGKVEDSNHHMGGARMSDSADAGVVSTSLLVNGTKNLYVCSSAVFPCSGFSNPTHTVLALAVRLAEHLAKVSSYCEDMSISNSEIA